MLPMVDVVEDSAAFGCFGARLDFDGSAVVAAAVTTGGGCGFGVWRVTRRVIGGLQSVSMAFLRFVGITLVKYEVGIATRGRS